MKPFKDAFPIILSLLSRAWHGWLEELNGMLPPSVRQSLHGHAERVILRLDGKPTAQYVMADGSMPHAPVLAESLVTNKSPKPLAHVTINAAHVFMDRLSVPDAARHRLRPLLGFEIERRSPFQAKDTLFDYKILSHHAADKTLLIEWALTPVHYVQQAKEAAEALGFYPQRIGLEGALPGHLDYVFLRHAEPRFHLTRPAFALLAAAAFFVLCLVFIVFADAGRTAALTHETESLKQQAEAAEKTRQEGKKIKEKIASLSERAAEPKVLAILASVAQALPDDAWVYDFSLNGAEVHLMGFSPAASSLIEKLAAVPLFTNPHFLAPLTPQPATAAQAERFEIAFTVRERHAETGGE